MNRQLPMDIEAGTGSLLSPPISPQMSDRLVRPDFNRQSHWLTSRPMTPTFTAKDDIPTGKLRLAPKQFINCGHELNLKIAESSVLSAQQYGNVKEESVDRMDTSISEEAEQVSFHSQMQMKMQAEETIFDRNLKEASGSLYPRFIPNITVATAEDDLDYDEEFAMTVSDLDEIPTEGDVPKTAAEERAEKRKMKRFRLTHSQTRFLQSEFARQAHPDAAQRERLSKEIPGLSPRQVQVWFQNRRAKMKRLTSDDRERIMRSRALPEDFDTTQALHANHMKSSQHVGGLPSAHSPSCMGDEGSLFHHMRVPNEGNLIGSPISMGSNMSDYYVASRPASAVEIMSPISITHETPRLSGSSTPKSTNLHPMNPFSRSRSFPLIYQSNPHSPNLQVQEIFSRRRAESLASPLGQNPLLATSSWSHEISQEPDLHKSSSFATSFSPPYLSPSNNTDLPQNFQFSTVQNIFAPEIHLSLPPDGQWQGIQHSNVNQNENQGASYSDLDIHARHGPLTDRPDLYETQGQPLQTSQNFLTSQAGMSFQPSTVTRFPTNYNLDSLQHYQTILEQETAPEDISGLSYHRDSHFSAFTQPGMNFDGSSSSDDINNQSKEN